MNVELSGGPLDGHLIDLRTIVGPLDNTFIMPYGVAASKLAYYDYERVVGQRFVFRYRPVAVFQGSGI